MRKPVYAICEQQRRRSACASVQSDQHLCCSLPRQYNISSFYIRNFKSLATFCDCATRFESYPVANPEDRFSRDEAHTIIDVRVPVPVHVLGEMRNSIVAVPDHCCFMYFRLGLTNMSSK